MIPWGAIASGAGSLLGAWSASSTNRSMQRFAKDMSSTAHQREVADLRAAGLNPILSAGGSGASTPSPMLHVPGKELGRDISTARQVRVAEKVGRSQAGMFASKGMEHWSGSQVKKAQVGKLLAETEAIYHQMHGKKLRGSFADFFNRMFQSITPGGPPMSGSRPPYSGADVWKNPKYDKYKRKQWKIYPPDSYKLFRSSSIPEEKR